MRQKYGFDIAIIWETIVQLLLRVISLFFFFAKLMRNNSTGWIHNLDYVYIECKCFLLNFLWLCVTCRIILLSRGEKKGHMANFHYFVRRVRTDAENYITCKNIHVFDAQFQIEFNQVDYFLVEKKAWSHFNSENDLFRNWATNKRCRGKKFPFFKFMDRSVGLERDAIIYYSI